MSSSRSFLFYCCVLAVTAGSVVFGLDWVNAPMQPMAESEASVQTAKLAAHVPPPRPVVAATQARSVYPPRPLPQMANAGAAQPEPIIGAETKQIATPLAAPPPPPACDIAACSAAYRSFRAADCTWQPFDGPRRFCDKGHPGHPLQTEASAVPSAVPANEPTPGTPKCNVETCRQAYFTFNPADCTYQPANGPRKLCTK